MHIIVYSSIQNFLARIATHLLLSFLFLIFLLTFFFFFFWEMLSPSQSFFNFFNSLSLSFYDISLFELVHCRVYFFFSLLVCPIYRSFIVTRLFSFLFQTSFDRTWTNSANCFPLICLRWESDKAVSFFQAEKISQSVR